MKEKVQIKLDSVLGKLVRKNIYNLFNSDESYSVNIIYTITNITIEKIELHYIVNIESYRPGLIIGKGGKTADELTTKLNENIFNIFEDLGITFEVKLTECTLWNKLLNL